MLNDLLLSIIDNQSIINIELLEVLKGNIDKRQFIEFFDNLKLQDRNEKRIFIKNDYLVSSFRDNNKNNTFIIFYIYQDEPIDKFITGMKDWHIYEEIPF